MGYTPGGCKESDMTEHTGLPLRHREPRKWTFSLTLISETMLWSLSNVHDHLTSSLKMMMAARIAMAISAKKAQLQKELKHCQKPPG